MYIHVVADTFPFCHCCCGRLDLHFHNPRPHCCAVFLIAQYRVSRHLSLVSQFWLCASHLLRLLKPLVPNVVEAQRSCCCSAASLLDSWPWRGSCHQYPNRLAFPRRPRAAEAWRCGSVHAAGQSREAGNSTLAQRWGSVWEEPFSKHSSKCSHQRGLQRKWCQIACAGVGTSTCFLDISHCICDTALADI
jgi:hypothetical protein